MKIRCALLHFAVVVSAFGQAPPRPVTLPHPYVQTPTLGAESVTVVRLRPGYVSAVRVPEEVSSVVLGDPKGFAAEHSEAEPRLVFLKPLLTKPGETNLLITTKSGHEIPLHLLSSANGDVDFFLDFQAPHTSFMVPATLPTTTVAETKTISAEAPQPTPTNDLTRVAETELHSETKATTPKWQGKQLQVAVGQISEQDHRTVVSFSVLNKSDTTLELLPPQVQLSERAKQKDKKTKAEQVPIDAYGLSQRKLGPGERADGVVLFERPPFKESGEKLFLQVAQADAVDRPVLVPMAFTSSVEGGTR